MSNCTCCNGRRRWEACVNFFFLLFIHFLEHCRLHIHAYIHRLSCGDAPRCRQNSCYDVCCHWYCCATWLCYHDSHLLVQTSKVSIMTLHGLLFSQTKCWLFFFSFLFSGNQVLFKNKLIYFVGQRIYRHFSQCWQYLTTGVLDSFDPSEISFLIFCHGC